MGLFCSLSGFLITHKMEIEGDFTAEETSLVNVIENETLVTKLAYNYKVCRNAMKEPVMYLTILFFGIEGMMVPNFLEFIYYYSINELKMSQFEWGALLCCITVYIIFSVMIYSKFLRPIEPRTLVATMIFCFLFSAIF